MGDRARKSAPYGTSIRSTAKDISNESSANSLDTSAKPLLSTNATDNKDFPHALSVTPKPAFVSPRRVAPSSGKHSGAVAIPAAFSKQHSPTRAKLNSRGSPKRKITRPCSRDHLSDDNLEDDNVSLESFSRAPTTAASAETATLVTGLTSDTGLTRGTGEKQGTGVTPGTGVRRRAPKARSSSSDVVLEQEEVVNLATGGRVRSQSPDGRACCSPARDDSTRQYKRGAILKALGGTPPDVATLRQLAISRGGLLDNDLRQRAWPTLLGIDVQHIRPKPDAEVIKAHRDYQQVLLDVNRSSKRFPPGMLEEIRLGYQDQLIECIMWILVYHDELHYYQGFHDVVVTFLLVVGEDLTFAIMDKLVENHFRDYMEKTMEKTNYVLNYLLPVIGRASPELRSFMERSEVGNVFCLSWLITWFGHALSDFSDIVRLYDFFIACHPLMPIYLAADIVLYREKEVLSTDCDMPLVHSLLSRIPQDLPFELLVTRAGDLFIQYPPSVLEPEARAQYDAYVQAIEARRLEALARRDAMRTGPAKGRPRGSTGPAAKRREGVGGLVVRLSLWTLVGALGAVAFGLYKSDVLFDWRLWWIGGGEGRLTPV